MSTRALYTFGPDEFGQEFNVYKHYDGYPSGAAHALDLALTKAWPIPRFESDEFAAAFIAANKERAGDVRLMPSGDPVETARVYCSDIEFRYRFMIEKGRPHVFAYRVNLWGDEPREEKIYSGPISGLANIEGD